MSEMPPERPAPARTGGGMGGTFTNKIGPLPMWGWLAIIGGGLIVWRLYSNRQAASTSGSGAADTSVPADQVPQFVNQTYVTSTPPVQGPPGPPGPPGGVIDYGFHPVPTPQQLTRTWTSQGGSTYAQVAQRLLGRPDVSSLHPANAAAQKWVAGPYAKNHNAKMPRGLEFTYTEGTVTPKVR